MKQEISALMDGELFEDETENFLGRIKRDPAATREAIPEATREKWEMYHLIGDVLRQPEHIHCDLSARVRKLMQEEPTVLAPRSRAMKQKARAIALSAAASLVAIGVVVWMSLQVNPQVSPQMATQATALRPVNLQIRPYAHEYLMAHQEFSPSTDMNGGASYIHTVTYNPDEK